MNKPNLEHIEWYKNLKKDPVDTTTHPLDNFSTIEQKFTTPFMESVTAIPEDMRKHLCDVLVQKETAMSKTKNSDPEFYSLAQSKGFYATTHYNLFAEKDMEEFPEAKDSILEFEQISCQMIRYYIRKGWGVQQADDMKIEGRCFGNVQEPGARTHPHYHQDISGVLVHYLRVGDEDVSLTDQIRVNEELSPRHGQHTVMFQDPRPAIGYPYWEKNHCVTPQIGLTIIHPNYVWHETNPWLGKGTRVCIVVNFRIVSHGYNELLQPLRG
jgi:hypothetical protein